MKTTIRIGSGAGFSGDRIEPAIDLAQRGRLDYLVYECLAERTIALAQLRKSADPDAGYDPLLDRRIRPLIPLISRNKFRVITNMGAANPIAAGRRVAQLAREAGVSLTIAVVEGDEVLDQISPEATLMESGKPVSSLGELISANAYLGTEAILPALETDADIILAGRLADPSLFLAPMIHEFGWKTDDWNLLGQGTVIGHLLECAGQITGGYFMDPGVKDVPDPANLGFPFAEIREDGTATISKLPGTGGRIDLRTAKEQLLYEVLNPFEYLTPDVRANFSEVTLTETGPNELMVSGGKGRPAPDMLKVSLGYHAFFQGEGEISYGGPNAVARGKLAGEIVRERLSGLVEELRIDLIGQNSLHPVNQDVDVPEVRLRVAGKAPTAALAMRIGEEVEALYTNGPAGGGGARKSHRQVVGIASTLLPRQHIVSSLTLIHA